MNRVTTLSRSITTEMGGGGAAPLAAENFQSHQCPIDSVTRFSSCSRRSLCREKWSRGLLKSSRRQNVVVGSFSWNA